MELQQIRYVLALARERHFGKASQAVGVSQPTLSAQIKKLETELGTPLFERSSRSVRLTEAGKSFVPRVAAGYAALKEARELAVTQKNTLAGVIRLASIPTLGPYLLPKLIPLLRKKAPLVTLEVFEYTTSVLVDHLKGGRFDLGLLALPITDAALVTRELGREDFVVGVGKGHLLQNKKRLAIDDLDGEDVLMLTEGHCYRDQALTFCAKNKVKPSVVFEGSSLVSVLNLAATGFGVTLVPRMAVEHHQSDRLRFLDFVRPVPERIVGAVWRMSAVPDLKQRLLMDLVAGLLRQKAPKPNPG